MADNLKKILVVDDDSTARRTLDRFLTSEGYEVTTAADANEAMLAVHVDAPDIILSDIYMPGKTGLEMQESLTGIGISVPMIFMTGQDDMPTTIKAMQLGAYDYIAKPVDLARLLKILERLLDTIELSDKLNVIVDEKTKEHKLEDLMVGHDERMLEIFKTIGNVTRSRVTVLIEGESGTGKELIARAIHFNSSWNKEPFIAGNCTALAETLLESELFGHVKGSFTGATTDKKGKFELAGEGTIFLDEIAEISAPLQVKLLRVLQQREFERVGGEKTIPMKARIIAATNRDMMEEVRSGRFRDDLYYRLNVVSIKVPPLRERKEDIPFLVKRLLTEINTELHTKVMKITDAAMEMIKQHDWPGNVRELQNVLTRAVVLSKSDILEEADLQLGPGRKSVPESYNWNRTLAQVEQEHIEHVLKAVKGNKKEAAKVLGISKPTLYSRLPSTEKE